MQSGKDCQRHIWLLSGTGEGLPIAKALIKYNWRVTVSVVSYQASLLYRDLSLEGLWVGSIDGVKGIMDVLRKSQFDHQGFEWVIDATHPFAEEISSNLIEACVAFEQPLLRFERTIEESFYGTFLKSSKELSSFQLKGQRILMAIGSRYLKDAVLAAKEAGAKVFARLLPTPKSLRNALDIPLPSNHLALLKPFSGGKLGSFELALCQQWDITGIVCRQSGGVTEKLWREISMKNKLNLWLISRPIYCNKVEIFNNLEDLLSRLCKFE